jgi:hypothetical protein
MWTLFDRPLMKMRDQPQSYAQVILEGIQSKALRMTVDAPWYVPSTVIRRDLQIPTVKEEIRLYSSQYSAHLSAHPNHTQIRCYSSQYNARLSAHPNHTQNQIKSHPNLLLQLSIQCSPQRTPKSHPKSNHTQIRCYSSHYSARLSAHQMT